MKASEMLKDQCCGQLYNALDGKSELVKMVQNLERKVDDKIKLIKFVDKGNSLLSTENNQLKDKVVFLDHQLNNAIAEIQKRPKR